MADIEPAVSLETSSFSCMFCPSFPESVYAKSPVRFRASLKSLRERIFRTVLNLGLRRVRNWGILALAAYPFILEEAEVGVETSASDFGAPLSSGFYQYSGAVGDVPDTTSGWTHLINGRHSNSANIHQLQLASTYTVNDRLFPRKIATGLTSSNPMWNEVATRATNSFSGNQAIGSGYINLNTTSTYGGDYPTNNADYNNVLAIGGVGAEAGLKIYKQNSGSQPTFVGNYNWQDAYVFEFTDSNGNDPDGGIVFGATGSDHVFDGILYIQGTGNVGVGTKSPSNKFEVNGAIRSKEVIVESVVWPDYVFEDGYALPSLEEVESHIEERGYLPGVEPTRS